MNRRLLFVLAGMTLLGGATALLVLNRPAPAPAETPVAEARPVPAPRRAAAAPEGAKPEPAPPPAESRRRDGPEPGPVATAPVEEVATAAILRIDSDVPGAQVFVDRQFVGEAPVTAPDIKPGRHVINLSAKGYEGVATTIDVSPGPLDVIVKLREVRLDVKLQVVHKHRLGSCAGQLVATPKGLRYETTDKGDAFSTALLDLDTFEVDYLQKNLKIKVRKGKEYNFTDPGGNADPLFVFHRDVDKARERLKKGDPAAEQ